MDRFTHMRALGSMRRNARVWHVLLLSAMGAALHGCTPTRDQSVAAIRNRAATIAHGPGILAGAQPPVCVETATAALTSCANAPSADALRGLMRDAGTLGDVRRDSASPLLTNAMARLDLLSAGRDTMILYRAERAFSAAAHQDSSNDALLTDLSAARLALYAHTGEFRHAAGALDASARASRHGTTTVAACWNTIVALQALRLARQQAVAIAQCRAKLPDAAPRFSQLMAPGNASADTGRVRATGWDVRTWERAWVELLPRFADALVSKQVDAQQRAGAALDSVVGDSLFRAIDQSVARAVRELREAAANPAVLRALAQSHRVLARDRAAGRGRAPVERLAAINEALLTAPRRSEVERWLRLARANQLLIRGETREALAEYQAARRPDEASSSIAGGRIAYNIAATRMAAGERLEAVREFEAAARACAEARRNQCALSASSLAAGVSSLIGDAGRYGDNLARALAYLDGARPAQQWSLLTELWQYAESEGLLAASAVMFAESQAAARETGNMSLIVDEVILHARGCAARNDVPCLRRDLQVMRDAQAATPAGEQREAYAGDILWIAGELALRQAPASAPRVLDSAVQLVDRSGNVVRQLRPRLALAKSLLLNGDSARSLSVLNAALELLARAEATQTSVFDRASLQRYAAGFRELATALLLARGQAHAALRAMVGRPFAGAPVQDCSARRRPATIAIRSLGDSLLIWSSDDCFSTVRVVAGAQALLVALHRETWSDEQLSRAYDTLIRPELERGARGNQPSMAVRLSVDGALAGVPWAALRDRDAGRFFVEAYRIELVEQYDAPAPVELSGRTALTIVDAVSVAGADALPYARREVVMLQSLWQDRASVVAGEGQMTLLNRAVSGKPVLHFVGHARFNQMRPERSYLQLGGLNPTKWFAVEIARARLRGWPTVVLAACETVVAGESGGSGFDSLAGAFLDAGAASVIGATAPIDDRTTQQFVRFLHVALARGAGAAEALQSAQLAAMQSDDPALRSPRTWAVFHLLGRR